MSEVTEAELKLKYPELSKNDAKRLTALLNEIDQRKARCQTYADPQPERTESTHTASESLKA